MDGEDTRHIWPLEDGTAFEREVERNGLRSNEPPSKVAVPPSPREASAKLRFFLDDACGEETGNIVDTDVPTTPDRESCPGLTSRSASPESSKGRHSRRSSSNFDRPERSSENICLMRASSVISLPTSGRMRGVPSRIAICRLELRGPAPESKNGRQTLAECADSPSHERSDTDANEYIAIPRQPRVSNRETVTLEPPPLQGIGDYIQPSAIERSSSAGAVEHQVSPSALECCPEWVSVREENTPELQEGPLEDLDKCDSDISYQTVELVETDGLLNPAPSHSVERSTKDWQDEEEEEVDEAQHEHIHQQDGALLDPQSIPTDMSAFSIRCCYKHTGTGDNNVDPGYDGTHSSSISRHVSGESSQVSSAPSKSPIDEQPRKDGEESDDDRRPQSSANFAGSADAVILDGDGTIPCIYGDCDGKDASMSKWIALASPHKVFVCGRCFEHHSTHQQHKSHEEEGCQQLCVCNTENRMLDFRSPHPKLGRCTKNRELLKLCQYRYICNALQVQCRNFHDGPARPHSGVKQRHRRPNQSSPTGQLRTMKKAKLQSKMEQTGETSRIGQLEDEIDELKKKIGELESINEGLVNIILQFQELVTDKKMKIPPSLYWRIQQHTRVTPDPTACSPEEISCHCPASIAGLQPYGSRVAATSYPYNWQCDNSELEFNGIAELVDHPSDLMLLPEYDAVDNIANEAGLPHTDESYDFHNPN